MSQGRPPLGAKKRAIQASAYLTAEEIQQLDRARGQQSRSDYVRAVLRAALVSAQQEEVQS